MVAYKHNALVDQLVKRFISETAKQGESNIYQSIVSVFKYTEQLKVRNTTELPEKETNFRIDFYERKGCFEF